MGIEEAVYRSQITDNFLAKSLVRGLPRDRHSGSECFTFEISDHLQEQLHNCLVSIAIAASTSELNCAVHRVLESKQRRGRQRAEPYIAPG